MRVELDEEHQTVILEAETAAERDSLLRTLMYPAPLNPEDVRDLRALKLADYELKPEGGTAGFGVVLLQFERPASGGAGGNVFDPERELRPLRVPSGEVLSREDIEGNWRFAPSPGSSAPAFEVTINPDSVPVAGTEIFALLTGEWHLVSMPGTRLRFTGSADGRSAFFNMRLNHNPEIRLHGTFTARGMAIATYLVHSEHGVNIGQVQGLKA